MKDEKENTLATFIACVALLAIIMFVLFFCLPVLASEQTSATDRKHTDIQEVKPSVDLLAEIP